MARLGAGRLTELRRRQISLCLCVGLSNRQMADVLGAPESVIAREAFCVLEDSGMDSRFEFALRQNAAVREELWP